MPRQATAQGQNASDPDADAWVGVHEQSTLAGSDFDGNRVEGCQAPLALVIDDNRASRDLCTVRLTAMGCRVLTAENGLAGWRIARLSRPDIIILDISMPVMDGCELAQRIRADEHLAKVPLIAITAFGSGWQEAALACGCTSVLEKPTESPEFERVVRAALAGPSSRRVGVGSG
jgi:CheY-like chemotaxis protein